MIMGLIANIISYNAHHASLLIVPSIVFFGMSKYLWQALLFRGLNGLFNANTGLVKTYIRVR